MNKTNWGKVFVLTIIVFLLIFLIYEIGIYGAKVTRGEELIYCKTTFQGGLDKYCDIEICNNGGCKFVCNDGTKIDSSFYTQECNDE